MYSENPRQRGNISYIVTGVLCVDLKEKKVWVPKHLFFRRIAGPSGRRDSQNLTLIKYYDALTPFLPYKMIPHWIYIREVQISSLGEI